MPILIQSIVCLVSIFWLFSCRQPSGSGVEAEDTFLENITWTFEGSAWNPSGTPPACPSPIKLGLPYEHADPSALLYPGQVRGDGYRSHGGFRFDSQTQGQVRTIMPMDAQLIKASRYLEDNETQYYLVFIHPCGLMFKLDHLRQLAAAISSIENELPEAKPNDSRSTQLKKPIQLSQGTVLAFAIGIPKTQNFFFDFGFYDLRSKQQDLGHASNEFDDYGLCFLDYFSAEQAAQFRALPSGQEGKQSDYCQ